jgi:hypothetical protein
VLFVGTRFSVTFTPQWTRQPKPRDLPSIFGRQTGSVCVFINAVPITKLFAWMVHPIVYIHAGDGREHRKWAVEGGKTRDIEFRGGAPHVGTPSWRVVKQK